MMWNNRTPRPKPARQFGQNDNIVRKRISTIFALASGAALVMVPTFVWRQSSPQQQAHIMQTFYGYFPFLAPKPTVQRPVKGHSKQQQAPAPR